MSFHLQNAWTFLFSLLLLPFSTFIPSWSYKLFTHLGHRIRISLLLFFIALVDKAYLLLVRKPPDCWGANCLMARIVNVHHIQRQQKIARKFLLEIAPVHAMKAYVESRVHLHTFLTCWVESAWLYSWTLFCRASIHWVGAWVGRCDLMAGIEPRLLCRTVA